MNVQNDELKLLIQELEAIRRSALELEAAAFRARALVAGTHRGTCAGQHGPSVIARVRPCAHGAEVRHQDERVVGLLTAENLGEFLMIQGALKGERTA